LHRKCLQIPIHAKKSKLLGSFQRKALRALEFMARVKAITCLIAIGNSNLISIFFRAFQFTSSFIPTMTNPTRVFFEESSVHGFSYIANQKLHAAERLLWIVALICSFICCGLLTFKIGVKFKEDAMVTYTSDDSISVVNVSIGHRFSSENKRSQVSDSVCCCHLLSRSRKPQQ
jgi:hypothetical protein